MVTAATAHAPARWSVEQGHALDLLRRMSDESVQAGICSPPYWGLRSYQTEPQVWGGDPGCDHVWGPQLPHGRRGNRGISGTGGNFYPPLDNAGLGGGAGGGGEYCQHSCGAWRGELGLEPTPTLFIDHLTAIFREFRRVLRKDGLLWIVVGDSYYGSGKGAWKNPSTAVKEVYVPIRAHRGRDPSLKNKDLVGIPWMLAFALRDDGWYLRQENIWHKPNAMPSSVRDRTTRAHETVFMLSRSPRYFYDAAAIEEPAAGTTPHDLTGQGYAAPGQRPQRGNRRRSGGGRTDGYTIIAGSFGSGARRNARTVWSINTAPFPGAHFATFPPALVERMIRASTRPDDLVCDPFCGAGTTGLVALHEGRRFVGLELNPDYVAMSRRRLAEVLL